MKDFTDRTIHVIPAHQLPMRLNLAEIRSKSDEELLGMLSGEQGTGMITGAQAALIQAELNKRAIARAAKPHWSVVPSFWLLIASVLLTTVGIAISVLALPPVQQRVAAYFQPQQTPPPGQGTPAPRQPASPR